MITPGGGFGVEPGRDCQHDGDVVVGEHRELKVVVLVDDETAYWPSCPICQVRTVFI